MADVTVGDEIIYRIKPNPTAKRGIISRISDSGSIVSVEVHELDMQTRNPTGNTQRVLIDCIDCVVTGVEEKNAEDAYDRAMKGI